MKFIRIPHDDNEEDIDIISFLSPSVETFREQHYLYVEDGVPVGINGYIKRKYDIPSN
tara:strand:+ start:146 stop:319 length:174 start_codon:yes stop_codon:yes gene_type:complete